MVLASVSGFTFVQGEKSSIDSPPSDVQIDSSFEVLQEKDVAFDDVYANTRFEKIWGSLQRVASLYSIFEVSLEAY